MRLAIEHETHYRFGSPAQHSIQYLRLTPRADPSQLTRSWQVSTSGKLKRWSDGFGNVCHVSVQNGLHDAVPVIVRGEVETFDTFGVLPADDGLPPSMFLRSTRYTGVEGGIAALAKPFIERVPEEGAIAALHGLMWALHNAVSYTPGATDVDNTAAEALERGSGVCQDLAHLFIASCRTLNVPARYVSGYLLAQSDQRGSLSSHAWAEAYIDDLGWVSFDPTNCQSATDGYVRLAVAFDYSGASPIRGLRKGGGLEEMTVRVDVVQSPTQTQSQSEGGQQQSQAQ